MAMIQPNCLLLISLCLINRLDYIATENSTDPKVPVAINSEMPDYLIFPAPNDDQTPLNRSTRHVTLLASCFYSGDVFPVGAIGTKSMEIAFERLRQQPNWLAGYDLKIKFIDDQCDDALAIKQFVEQLEKSEDALFPVYIGIGCTAFAQKINAEIAKHYNFITIQTAQMTTDVFTNRKRYGSLYGLSDRLDLNFIVLVKFIARMNWQSVAVIAEESAFYDHIEQEFIRQLELNNITLGWFGKLNYVSNSVEEYEEIFSDMKKADQRIIIVNADSTVAVACWLHRFQMFGPNYVIFFYYWVYFNAESAVIPEYVASWCTADMIRDVLHSVIFTADKSRIEAFGASTVFDSTGYSGSQFLGELAERVIEADQSPFFGFFPPLFYDAALFTGYMLNRTEEILKSRNDTLAAWSTTSSNFRENGNGIEETLRQAIYSVKVDGMKGEYRFEADTTVNSGGYTPDTFTQVQFRNKSQQIPEEVVIAFYKSNERLNPLTIHQNLTFWATKDGKPPKGRIDVKRVIMPTIPISTIAPLMTFAIVGIVVSLVTFGFELFPESGRVFGGNVLMWLGNCAILSQVIALPTSYPNETTVAKSCQAMTGLLLFGYSLNLIGTFWKLEVAKSIPGMTKELMTGVFLPALQLHRKMVQSRKNSLSFSSRFNTVRISIIVTMIAVSQTILIIAFLNMTRIGALLVRLSDETNNIVDDDDVNLQSFAYTCSIGLNSSDSSLSLIVAIALILLIVNIKTVQVAFVIHSKSKNKKKLSDFEREAKRLSYVFYCQELILLAGTFIVVTLDQQPAKILIAISSIAICYATIGIVFQIIAVKFRNKNNGSQQNEDKRGRRSTITLGASNSYYISQAPISNITTTRP